MNIINIDDTFYLFSNLFRMYVLYLFIQIFFERSFISKKIEIGAFFMYYIINSIVQLILSNPVTNLFTNLFLLFILTLIYSGKMSTRFISSVLIYSINILLDGIVYIILTKLNTSIDITIATSVISNILLYIFVLILSRIFIEKNKYELITMQWAAIFLIPIGSIFISATLLLNNYRTIQTLTSVCFLLVINILVFYLYDMILKSYKEKYEIKLVLQQNKAYLNELQIISESQEKIKMFRHDMKNHIYIIQEMVKSESKQELLKYLKNTFDFINIDNGYVSSGNHSLDSILNYKIGEAKKLGIDTKLNIKIPNGLKISIFDLNIILGNLIDNAISALKNVKEKTFYLSIQYDKGLIFIEMENNYSGKIIVKDNVIQTTKQDKESHGLGMKSIEYTVKKYNGIMNISYNENTFKIQLLLYDNIK